MSTTAPQRGIVLAAPLVEPKLVEVLRQAEEGLGGNTEVAEHEEHVISDGEAGSEGGDGEVDCGLGG